MQTARVVLSALIVTGVALLGPPPARAHAFLDHAEPRVGSTVHAPPPAVSLTFTEPVESSFSHLTVRNAHGEPVTTGELEHPKPEELRQALAPLPPGDYTVQWSVTSVDTHQTEGHFEFTVAPP